MWVFYMESLWNHRLLQALQLKLEQIYESFTENNNDILALLLKNVEGTVIW